MSEYAPWIGRCFFREWLEPPAQNTPIAESRVINRGFKERSFKDYAGYAAVWTDSQAGFLAAVKRHLEAQGYAFTWAEDILPVVQWLSEHGYQSEVMALSPRVGPEHPLEMGAFTRTGEDGQPLPEVAPVVITRQAIPELPDQTGVPFWERAWIAPELKALLFEQPEGLETPFNTYLLVDATLRKNIVGAFDLDAVDVPVQCLFEGEGSEAQKASAPYLIDLTLPEDAADDVDRVPRFHKDLFARHWTQETGIVIRTADTFEATWRHCQAHLKVPVEGEARQLFLRYWHPETLDTLLPVLERGDAYQLLRRHRLIYPRDGEVVHAELHPELEIDAFVEEQALTLKPAYLEAFVGQVERGFRRKIHAEFVLDGDMPLVLYQEVIEAIDEHNLRDRDVIRGVVEWSCRAGENILALPWVKTELSSSSRMPDQIRFDRLKNVARKGGCYGEQ